MTVSNILTVTDLFTLGLGCEIAAAGLLAKGLLASPGQIRSIGSTRFDYNSAQIEAAVEDRTAALFGLRGLVLGFLVQIVGYVLTLGGMASNAEASWSRAAFASVLALLGAAGVVGAYRRGREGVTRRTLIDVACVDAATGGTALPDAVLLEALARDRWPRHDGESERDYARRVWGVGDVRSEN